MATPFKNPVNGILPGFQVSEAVQLTFFLRGTEWWLCTQVWFFKSKVILTFGNLLHRFSLLFTIYHMPGPSQLTFLQAYQYCKLVVWQTPWRTWLRIWIDYDWCLKCTVNRSKVCCIGFHLYTTCLDHFSLHISRQWYNRIPWQEWTSTASEPRTALCQADYQQSKFKGHRWML